jgi:signal transduction histidine kinase
VIARRLVRPLEQLAKAAPSFSEQALPRVLTDRSDELGILARALDGARERIINEQELRERSERLAMLGQIATGLAHEIKNPAAAILMQAELMDGGAGDLIRDEAEEIVGLVNQWLFIAQPSPPKVGMHDLASELRLMAERRGDVFSYRSVKAVVEVPELLEVECDVRRVMQAVRNLVDNAMAAMPDGGTLRLQLEEADGEACLTVFDTGDGFSETALARYGEPFYSEKEGGMGLGLVMVKRVIEAHGGRLEVENSQGGVVRMYLPVRKDVIV